MLLPLMAGVICSGGWLLFAVLLVFSSLGLLEFYAMFWPKGQKLGLKYGGLMVGALLLLCVQLQAPYGAFAVLLGGFWAANLLFLKNYSRSPEQADYQELMLMVAGLMYVPAILQFLLVFSAWEIFFLLLVTFASDTGAYYSGSFFGNKKVWPRISPKKTWAGSYGGMVLAVVCALIYGLLWGENTLPAAAWYAWPLMAIPMNLGVQFGDFFESALKRKMAIKDSGTVLPGHGGVLDRIDGLLLAVLVYAACRMVY